jgi:serine/threonine protein kinase
MALRGLWNSAFGEDSLVTAIWNRKPSVALAACSTIRRVIAMRSANDRNTRRRTGNHSRPAEHVAEGGQNALPVGQRIGEFEVAKLIGEGGFGIVYLAYDHSLHRNVALKEYMPSGFASRTGKLQVAVSTAHYAEAFEAGLRSFVNEARMLAQFDSPSLVKVYRFWEGNGTAYMVMPYYEGMTLRQAVKENRITPSEPWIREFLANIFDAIETIHRVQCFHRDIAPDNILLLKDGRPLLLDFGAARRVIEDLTHSPTAILKPGFAPIEQYAKISGMRQGAWTDVYALAAVLYFLITGARPPPAVMRMLDDEMVPALEAGKGRYSPAFLAAIDKALAVRPEQRIQSIADLRRAFAESDPEASAKTSSVAMTQARQSAARLDDPEKTRVNALAGSSPRTGTQANNSAATTDARQVPQAPNYRASYRPLQVPNDPSAAEQSKAATGHGRVRSERAAPAPSRREPWLSNPDATGADARRAAAPMNSRYVPPAPSFMENNRWARLAAHGITQQGLAIALVSAGVALGVYLGAQQFLLKSPMVASPTSSDRGLPGDTSALHGEVSASTKPTTGGGLDALSTPASGNVPPSSPTAESPEAPPTQSARAVVPPPAAPTANPQAPLANSAPALAMATPRGNHNSAGSSGVNGENESSTPSNAVTEKDLWRSTRKSADARNYANYLAEFPNGRHAADARAWLKRDAGQRALAQSEAKSPTTADARASAPAGRNARESDDELDWASTVARNQPTSYEGYLARHPKGRFAAIASAKLAPLKPADRNADQSVDQSAAQSATRSSASPDAPKPASAAAIDPKQRSLPASDSATPWLATPADPGASRPQLQAATSGKKSEAAASRTTRDPGAKNLVQFADQTVTGDFSIDPTSGSISGRVHIDWTNGNQFDGTLVRGVKQGSGQFVWANGHRYRGDWARDKPNGKGTIWFEDGGKYQGDVRDGQPDGVGVMTFPQNDLYEGHFMAGKPHGVGKMRFRNGDRYDGGFASGLKQGQGRMTWASGDYWQGEFRSDRMTENGKLVRADKPTGERQAAGVGAGETSGAAMQAETHSGDGKQ